MRPEYPSALIVPSGKRAAKNWSTIVVSPNTVCPSSITPNPRRNGAHTGEVKAKRGKILRLSSLCAAIDPSSCIAAPAPVPHTSASSPPPMSTATMSPTAGKPSSSVFACRPSRMEGKPESGWIVYSVECRKA